MASLAPSFDLDALLAPISGSAPTGDDLSFSAEFDLIQEARRSDDPTLDQGEWVTAIKEADWSTVIDTCETLLRERTKDLRLASWYTEAAAKLFGVKGLGQGFALMNGLLAHYWDSVHPLPENGDLEQRIGNLSWLIARCREISREMPLVSHKTSRFGLIDLELARSNTDEMSADRISLQQFKDAQRHTPAEFYSQLLQDCAACQDALTALSARVDDSLGMDGPSFTPLRDALETYSNTAARLARENGIGSATDLPSEEHTATAQSPQAVSSLSGSGPIASREQALQQLKQVADYFRRTEPHSPVAYLAEKAARWGNMPLHEWLRAVLKEDTALARFDDLLGVEHRGGE